MPILVAIGLANLVLNIPFLMIIIVFYFHGIFHDFSIFHSLEYNSFEPIFHSYETVNLSFTLDFYSDENANKCDLYFTNKLD